MPSAATISSLHRRGTPSPPAAAATPASPPLSPSPPDSPDHSRLEYDADIATQRAIANAQPGETIATTKEEEWVTRKKKEVTTTRQIETRVKREVVLEDGRLLSDSGPKVSTSTHEDTHTTDLQHSEHRALDPQSEDELEDRALDTDEVDGTIAYQAREVRTGTAIGADGSEVATPVNTVVTARVVSNPDGKVRESRSRRKITHNVTNHVRETEEEFHRGDTTHEAFVAAVNETEEDDIRDALKRQTHDQQALVPRGPRVVRDSTAFSKTIDTEDTDELRAYRPDGTLVTETKRSTEHEYLRDQELPENEARSLASDESATRERSGRERRARLDTERVTELMAGGKRVASQVHSRTRTEEAEKEGNPNMEDAYDWDSLSMRMRRQRRLRYAEHETIKDSFAKRPIDFDLEEETRKKETSKWLENHFGSESRSSQDSICEEISRKDPAYFKSKAGVSSNRDEGYYGKKAAPPPPRPPTKTSPTEERGPPKTGGYFKGVADWSQRRADKPRMPEPRSASPSPPKQRSPYGSTDRINGKHYKRDSPGYSPTRTRRTSRAPPSDSAYVSSSTVHSPPRGSPYRVEQREREPSLEEEYRTAPSAPERRRHKASREEQRYDSGYRSSSRNETSGRSRDSEGASEPAPDYSPPRERRVSPEPSPPPRRRDERKPHQKTRFAADSRRRSPAAPRKSVGTAISDSIRKLVGKIRSASAERRAKRRSAASRSPSPADLTSRTYRPYEDADLAPPPAAPATRYYLGEDPFAGSIYGREHKYEGASPRRTSARDKRSASGDQRSPYSSTLGRFSHSTSRLNPNSEQEDEFNRSAQTLPRKLQVKREKKETTSSDKRWHQLGPSKRSSSALNVSIASPVNGKVNGHTGPAKPARTYKALNRSKSFAMGVPETEIHPRYESNVSRNYSTMYKSNPHLSKLDEHEEQLKSPGIVSIINRSQRDLADAVSRETERRRERDGLFGARYKSNGINGRDETDKKKIFMNGLKQRAPELFHTIHTEEDSEGSRHSSRYNTPSPNYVKERFEERRFSKDGSPSFGSPGFVSRLKSPDPRRGSNSSDNFSETYRYSTKSGDPDRPSVTDTVETVSKKVLPTRDGRGKEIVESRETKSITTGRYNEPITFKYSERPSFESRIRSPSPIYSERKNSLYKLSEKNYTHNYRH